MLCATNCCAASTSGSASSATDRRVQGDAIGVAWADPGTAEGFRSETLLELFYRVHFWGSISLTPDLQFVFDPASNPGDDLVVIPGVRLQMKF